MEGVLWRVEGVGCITATLPADARPANFTTTLDSARTAPRSIAIETASSPLRERHTLASSPSISAPSPPQSPGGWVRTQWRDGDEEECASPSNPAAHLRVWSLGFRFEGEGFGTRVCVYVCICVCGRESMCVRERERVCV